MSKLDNTSKAWFNYLANTHAKFADLGLGITAETLSGRLSEYGGVVVDQGASGWQPYFRTEEEMTLFVLKWA